MSYHLITAKSCGVEKSLALILKNSNYHTYFKENTISHCNSETIHGIMDVLDSGAKNFITANIRLTFLCLVLDIRHFALEFSAGAFLRRMRSIHILAHLQYSPQTSKCILGPRSIFSSFYLYGMIFSFWNFDFNKMGLYLSFLDF